MSDKPNNVERLEKLCGFDPAKKLTATSEMLAEVAQELKEERLEKAKTSAREQLRKAVELQEKMNNVRKEFNKQIAKFDKELGGLLGRLESGLRGEQLAVDDAEATK